MISPMKNNKGMALVEVIIAMAILAIVSIPIMNLMVSSAKYNARARERQHMTQSAESIMESFKAYDVEALCEQFQHGTFQGCDISGGVDAHGNPIPAGTMEVTGKDALGADTTVLFDAEGDFIGSADNTYEFKINSLKNETERYDAVITLAPYTLAGSDEVTQLSNMNQYKDAIFRSQESFRTMANAQISAKYQSDMKPFIVTELNTIDQIRNDYTVAEIGDYIKVEKRETIFRIQKGTNITATCTMRYYFKAEGIPYYDDALDPTSTDTFDYPTDGSLWYVDVILKTPATLELEFYNNPQEAGLERIFIYYYPDYQVEDVIKFETTGFSTTETLECYLIKQKRTDISEGEQALGESSYVPQINGTGTLKLFHNFNENIGGGATVPTVTPSGFAASQSYLDTGLIKTQKTLMYTIAVDLYEEGGTSVVTSLRGTIND